MKTAERGKSFEKRTDARQQYSGHIFFATKNGFYEGRLKNFSRYGLFIETKASVAVGEIITVALPYLGGTNTKRKGQIIWSEEGGYGIELFRKRHSTYLKLIK